MSRVSDLVEYHLKKESIVYEEKTDYGVLYYVKSIKRKNQVYVVEFNKNKSEWYCDCPSFKYRTGVSKEGYCKHVLFIRFLNDNSYEVKKV